MENMEIVGYTHCDGYVLCEECGIENHWDDEGDERVSPIFADSDWDGYPTCDHCGKSISDVRLTTTGIRQELDARITEIGRCVEDGAFHALLRAVEECERFAHAHGLAAEEWALDTISAMSGTCQN